MHDYRLARNLLADPIKYIQWLGEHFEENMKDSDSSELSFSDDEIEEEINGIDEYEDAD